MPESHNRRMPEFSASSLRLESRIVSGRAEVLAQRSMLLALSERCRQPGAMDFLEYFLTSPDLRRETPHLVIVGPEQRLSDAPPEKVFGALLVLEQRILGFKSGIFATEDMTGRRTLIAPAPARILVAEIAAQALMEAGAQIVLQSVNGYSDEHQQIKLATSDRGRSNWSFSARLRKVRTYLPLASTMDATLAAIGQRTRSNLRYYRRRAEADLGCTFVPSVSITREDFLAFGAQCAYPVSKDVAMWRYDSVQTAPGMFFSGVRQGDGRWLSLVGGRRCHGMTEIDWQMNRLDLPTYSLSTVMRSYLMEHEIAQGSTKLLIEGGTPHTMRFSFMTYAVTDMIVMRDSTMAWFLRRVGVFMMPAKKTFLRQIVTSPETRWRPWS